VQKLVADTIEAMGRLDIVISNAGWTQMRDFSNLDEGVVEEDWDKCFTMNVKTHLWLAYAAKEELEKSEGCIVTTASVAGLKPGGSSLVSGREWGLGGRWMLIKMLAVFCDESGPDTSHEGACGHLCAED
jgi:NAD(P)-dependent dehydrogenase (short-subunit alcohol dehydrogenase family)